MTTEIEPMDEADVPAVLELWRQTPGVGLNEGDDPAGLAAFSSRNPGLSLVARDAGRVVAAVLCGHDGRRGYLNHLAVRPEFRRHGLGRAGRAVSGGPGSGGHFQVQHPALRRQ